MISPKLKKAAENNAELVAMRPLPKETLKSLRAFYRVGLTYSSNAIEGNSLTETETKVVIEDGLTIGGKPLRDVYEALGHAKAYDKIHLLAKHKSLEESDILNLHKLFYQLIDKENAGKYRTVPVFISGSQFVFIHPFVDGNGRVARLIMNLALLRGEYTVAIIPAFRRMEYVAAFEAAHKDVATFVDFIADCVVSAQEDLLRLLKNSGGVKTSNGGVNLQDKILQEIKNNGGLNAPSLASRLSLSLRTVQRYLKELTESKKIEFRGAPKNGGYYSR